MREKRAMWHCVNYELNVWMCTGKNGCGGEIVLEQGTPKNYGMKFCPYCGLKMAQKKPGAKMDAWDSKEEIDDTDSKASV